MKIKIKQKAPNFKLPSTNGDIFELNKLKRKIYIIFLSKDDTPGCTLESQDFSKFYNMILKIKQLFMEYLQTQWKVT